MFKVSWKSLKLQEDVSRTHNYFERLLRRKGRPFLNRRSTVPFAGKDARVIAATTLSSSKGQKSGPSTDFQVIFDRLVKLGLPYWQSEDAGGKARWRLAGVAALPLGTTGVSVLFNFLARDFFNALSSKDVEHFYQMLYKWIGALFLGIPVFVMRDYFQSTLSLEWREWLTKEVTEEYFTNRAFYQVQAGELVDNPDQRIASDVRMFTETALSFSTGILNAIVDLVSFSGILYTIYPPLFLALLVYSVGGTAISLQLGKPLVSLNFQQEAKEADFRYGLVRVRENAESIAFYGGEASEQKLLLVRLKGLVENAMSLIVTERNLQFFTSFYRFLIGILPAAVVAPLYFQGKIEFGVVNQSTSAFNHILNDVSLVVFQFESIAGFGAIIDRLGQFTEVLEPYAQPQTGSDQTLGSDDSTEAAGLVAAGSSQISLKEELPGSQSPVLQLHEVTLKSPDGSMTLVGDLSLEVGKSESLLIVGPSGAGKTSILRAIAGLWLSGSGTITRFGSAVTAGSGSGDIFFVPQRPYVVLGTLREQLLYPTWSDAGSILPGGATVTQTSENGAAAAEAPGQDKMSKRPQPSDSELESMLRQVRLGLLLSRSSPGSNGTGARTGLDNLADWGGVLSLGEQQRLAFARVLLTKPKLVLMDESTSALDTENEAFLFRTLKESGITYISIGHRPTLFKYHSKVLRLLPLEDANDRQDSSAARSTWKVYPASQDPEICSGDPAISVSV